MEWVFIIQIIILYLTISPIGPIGHLYLGEDKKLFKAYILVEMIVQALFLVANFVLLFVYKMAMIFIAVSHIILAGIIQAFFDCLAKNRYFNMIKKKIIEYDLTNCDPLVIRNYFLENQGLACSIKDINKCLSKIHK